jgi:type IX secretion system substrate protein
MPEFKRYPIFFVVFATIIAASFHAGAQAGWRWGIGSTGTSGTIYQVGAAATDRFGNVFVSGLIGRTGGGVAGIITVGPTSLTAPWSYGDLVITKADSAGNFLWSIQSTDDHFSNPLPVGMATDDTGNLYLLAVQSGVCIIGAFTLDSLSNTSTTLFLAKISPSGTVIWAQNICRQSYGASTISSMYSLGNYSIGIDGGGNIYVSGSFGGASLVLGTTTLTNSDPTGNTSDFFIARYNRLGQVIWAKSLGGDNHDVPAGGAVTKDGNIYVGISSESSSVTTVSGVFTANPTVFGWMPSTQKYMGILARYDSSGNQIWAENLGSNIGFAGIAADDSDNIFAAVLADSNFVFGSRSFAFGTGVHRHLLICKFDSSGHPVWADSVTVSSPSYLSPNVIAVDQCDNVWLCGGADSTWSISGHLLSPPRDSSAPMFVAGYSGSGGYITSFALPSGGNNNGSCILPDQKGNLYLCGDYAYPAVMAFGIDTLPVSLYAGEELFIAKYNYDTLSCNAGPLHSGSVQSAAVPFINLYPNPAQTELNISSSMLITNASVTNLLGQRLSEKTYHSNQVQLDISNLPPGMYLVHINDVVFRRFVKE